ncbi:DNA-binding MarR family transcriptional regulator [Micromonospora sp. A200]|uniref:MarR family winged helix-turn-helix transcriptional regulator n=1 Tax=Micromonospora sp. A200 TaxID=2940568 RepID=UPI002473842A|nr:MarR family transcriptional regulator [Micromonospora sp. A200]MDH6461633.1 DNA-binding MarR family transcriptional regulator [Micromonospora sp. A200]
MGKPDQGRDTVDEIVAAWQRELPAVATLELELTKRATRLGALLAEAANRELAEAGLTKAEYEVLAALRATGAPYRLRPTELASRLLLSSGGTSNLLRRLTDSGLVVREADARDARSSWVRLTDAGVTTAETAVRAATTAQRELLAVVPESTGRVVADLLREVLIALGDTPRG